MEIILVLAILCGSFWWFFIRDVKKPHDEEIPAVPNDVTEPVATQISLVPSVPEVVVNTPVAAKPKVTKAKAPAKPKAPKAKAPVKPKAPAKPRAPRAPKA